MNLFKNGTAMVVVGTVIAAALILMTGRDDTHPAADQISKVEASEEVATPSSAETLINTSIDSSTQQEPTSLVSTEITSTTGENLEDKPSEEPVETVAETLQEGDASTETQVKKTLENKDESTDTKLVSLKADDATLKQVAPPAGLFKKLENDVTDSSPVEPLDKANTDTADKSATTASEEVSNTKKNDDLAAITESSSSPIWLDQKLGEFKSVNNLGVEGQADFNIMPINSSDLQGSNPERVVTSKAGKFLPSAVPENYNYQQMPMYNGGYYIAPMPSYLMPSVLPNSIVE